MSKNQKGSTKKSEEPVLHFTEESDKMAIDRKDAIALKEYLETKPYGEVRQHVLNLAKFNTNVVYFQKAKQT